MAVEFVTFIGGLTLPVDVVAKALELERRGIEMFIEGDKLILRPEPGRPFELSDEEMAFLKARKAHLMALVEYRTAA